MAFQYESLDELIRDACREHRTIEAAAAAIRWRIHEVVGYEERLIEDMNKRLLDQTIRDRVATALGIREKQVSK